MKPTPVAKSPPTPAQVEWNLPDGVEKFSEGHVYHAFRVGISTAKEQDKIVFSNQVLENSKKAAKDTTAVIEQMTKKSIAPLSAHLKVVSPYSFSVLVTVSDSDFVKESFVELYANIHEIENKSKSDLYSIAFTFVNRSASFDVELVQLDGYYASFKALDKSK